MRDRGFAENDSTRVSRTRTRPPPAAQWPWSRIVVQMPEVAGTDEEASIETVPTHLVRESAAARCKFGEAASDARPPAHVRGYASCSHPGLLPPTETDPFRRAGRSATGRLRRPRLRPVPVVSLIAEAVRVDVPCANGLDRRNQLKWKEQDVNQPR